MNRPAAPLSTSAVGCAAPRPAGNARTSAVRSVPSASIAHPRDAAVRGDPRAAAARRHEEANGAREAGAEVRVPRLERALPDPAVEQAAGADDQHAIALDRQEGAARRGHRRLAGAEALGQRIGHPAPPFEALDADVDEVADAAAAQHRPQHAVAALPHRQVRAGRRQAVHAIAVEDGDLADLAVTDEQAAGRAAGRVEGPRFDQPVGRRQEAPVGVVRLLCRGGPRQGDRGQQHEDRARGEGAGAAAWVDAREWWWGRYHQLIGRTDSAP